MRGSKNVKTNLYITTKRHFLIPQIEYWKTGFPEDKRNHAITYQNQPTWCENAVTRKTRDVKNRLKRQAQKERSTVLNLWSFANISAQIRVLNSKYEGPASNIVTFSTPEGGKGHTCTCTGTCTRINLMHKKQNNVFSPSSWHNSKFEDFTKRFETFRSCVVSTGVS